MYLEQMFQPSGYRKDWDGQTLPWRHARSSALCYLLADLWQLIAEWSEESMAPQEFFLEARTLDNSCTEITLLNVHLEDNSHLAQQGKEWRSKVDKYLSRPRLAETPPTDGPFMHSAPAFLLPTPAQSPAPADNLFQAQREHRAREARERRDQRRARNAAQREAAAAAESTRDRRGGAPVPAPSNHRPGRRSQIPTQGTTIARYCLIAPVPGVPQKEIHHILSGIPRSDPNRPQAPKVTLLGHEFHGKSLCFEYCSADGGCPHGDTCNYAHCDMNETQTQELPMSFFNSVQSFLHHPAIRPNWGPTSHLTNKLTSA